MKRITHFIDGKSYVGQAERSGDVFNPATGEISAAVDFASIDVVDEAVAVAKRASHLWRQATLARRTQVLFAFREIVNSEKEELARAITAEHGKVFSDALGEVTQIGRAPV